MTSTGHAQTVKRVLAAASLGAAAVDVGSLGHSTGVWDKGVLGVAALVGIAAVGLTRRSVLPQVLGRGVAWLVLAPSLLGLGEAVFYGRMPDGQALFFAATSAGALLLARSALHTDAARAEFAPVGYRRVFLAGAVAAAMTGAVMGLYAAADLAWHQLGHGLALAALAGAFLASAVGVVRMRAWGVLLGMVTSVVVLGAAVLSGNGYVAMGLALAAIPGAVLASPLLAARLRRSAPSARPDRAAYAMTVEHGLDAAPAVLARIAVPPEAEGEEIAHPVRFVAGERS